MNIGDKVRMLHGHEQGIVRKFMGNNLVEIEIEDGFTIPVLKNELVVVAKEEQDHFKKEEVISRKEPAKAAKGKDLIAQEGIYLVFLPINDQRLSLHFINNTDFEVAFSLSLEEGTSQYGLLAGKLNPRESVKVNDWDLGNFDHWSPIYLQLIYHRPQYFTLKAPLMKKVSFKAASFFKRKKQAPVINKEGYLFQLDEQEVAFDKEKIKESFFKQKEFPMKDETHSPVQKVVDLHIEEISSDPKGLSHQEILQLQMETFEKKLDQAIAFGLDEITFIHGIGNGVLRNHIHQKLSKIDNIVYFKDAMKEKFGYGATLVKIK